MTRETETEEKCGACEHFDPNFITVNGIGHCTENPGADGRVHEKHPCWFFPSQYTPRVAVTPVPLGPVRERS